MTRIATIRASEPSRSEGGSAGKNAPRACRQRRGIVAKGGGEMRTHLLATTVVDLVGRKAHWAKKFLAQRFLLIAPLALAAASAPPSPRRRRTPSWPISTVFAAVAALGGLRYSLQTVWPSRAPDTQSDDHTADGCGPSRQWCGGLACSRLFRVGRGQPDYSERCQPDHFFWHWIYRCWYFYR